jgi:protein involved in polysaccharide export with SLBB domain
VVYTFDTYQYLLDPKNNIFLEDGDFVVIKPVQSKVKINGGVNRPGLIELINGETLNDAVKYAGGFSTKSDPTRITLSRLDGIRRSLIPINFNESKTELFDGDELFIFQQREEIFNGIEIEGEVYFPGKYSLGENETIRTFIEKSGGLTEKANSEFAFVIRTYQDGTVDYLKTNLDGSTSSKFELKYNDKIVVFGKDYFKDDFTVEIKGEVRNPQSIPFKKGLTLQSLIDYAGGFKYSADQTQIKIIRSEVFDSTFIKGNLNRTKKIIVKVSKTGATYKVENVFLQPTDIVTVGRVSNLEDRISVSVSGEVIHPGIHVFPKGLNSVNDLLEEVGGFTEFAYPEGAQLIRANGDQVVFDLSKGRKFSDYNYKLITGDQIVVPTRPDVVKLYNTDSLLNKQYVVAPHIGGRAGKYYRQFSLGFNKDFRKRDLYSYELGGRISRSKNFGVFVLTPKVKPGSELLFKAQKTKSSKAKKQKEEVDWNKFFEGLTTKLTALATIWVLTNQL